MSERRNSPESFLVLIVIFFFFLLVRGLLVEWESTRGMGVEPIFYGFIASNKLKKNKKEMFSVKRNSLLITLFRLILNDISMFDLKQCVN